MALLLLVLLVPVTIHLLVRARARVIEFPSLRFVRASPMRAVRRRLLSDPWLLAVRMAILGTAVAAVADVPLGGHWRRHSWNTKLARAVVVDARVARPDAALASLGQASVTTQIAAADLVDGMRRAQVWLASAPPARRELAIVSDFPLGAIDRRALDEVPAAVGLHFVRATANRAPAPVDVETVQVDPRSGIASRETLRVTTENEQTRVRGVPIAAAASWNVEETPAGIRLPALALDVLGSPANRSLVRAAATAALQPGAPVSPAIAARPIIVSTPGSTLPAVRGLSGAWMGEVGRAIARDPDLAAVRSTATHPPMVVAAPWIAVLHDRSGDPLVRVAAGLGEPCPLLVDTAFAPSSVALPLLLGVVLQARVADHPLHEAESLRIADADLRRWSRPAGDVRADDARDPAGDRRWWWAATLGLLAGEWWMRRRTAVSDAQEVHEPAA